MGLLDDLLGQLGGGSGMGRQPAPQRPQPTSVGANMGMGRILMALLPVVLSMLARRRQAGATGGGLGQGGRGLGPAGGGMGGGLGDVLGGMLGGGRDQPSGRASGGLGDVLGGLLGGSGGAGMGGLGGLLEGFQRAGFGRQAQSWVDTGQNEPIPPDAVEKVFGPGAIEEIARRSGLTQQETAQGLAQLLPEVVDSVTPDGSVPDPDALSERVEALMQRANLGGMGDLGPPSHGA